LLLLSERKLHNESLFPGEKENYQGSLYQRAGPEID